MTVSGTVSTTVFNTNNILDMAFRRCKIAPEIVTSEMQQTALDSLYLMISALCNNGIQLWTVEKIILPFYLGNGYIELPSGTIDLLNQNYRTISRYTGTTSSSEGVAALAEDNNLATSCTQTTPNGYILVNLLAQQNISTLGINMASAGAYDIIVSYSNDNSTYTTVLTPGSVTYAAGEWHWYDINPSINAQYWKLQAINGTILDVAALAEDNDLATSCTQTTPNGYILVNLLAQQNISTLGINMASAGAYDITVSYSNDNSTYTTVLTPGSVTYAAGEWHWYDINPAINAQYWKLQAINGTILDVAEFVVSGNPTEIPLARLNQDDYTNLPNKTFQGRPLQFWLDRQLLAPVMRLWPAPNQQAEFAQMVAWRQRHIMDVGSLTETIEVPQRWVDAIAWYLAYRLCFEIQQVDIGMADRLKPIADERMALAFGEERDNSPFQMYPNISPYTR